MPEYKLTYFDIDGVAEPIRFLLSYGGIDFEDVRLSKDEWAKIKSTTPFGKLPTLEHDGKTAHQSVAISRYVAKKVKLTGKNDWDDLQIDAVVETIYEVRMRMAQYHYAPNDQVKKSLEKNLYEVTIPYSFERLETWAKANNGYLAVGYLTWADVYLASMTRWFHHLTNIDVLENHPTLVKLRDEVYAIPNVKKWVEKRPKTAA